MAGEGVIQASFTSGELSPSLYGRIDLSRYQTGLKTCENFIVRQYGGVTNRPGTTFVGEVKDSSKAVRLIPFAFSTQQTYILEFGDYYMRVYKDGAIVVKTTGDTADWATSTSYTAGAFRKKDGVIYYCLVAHTSGTFATDLSNGKWVAQSTYEVVTPWPATALSRLSYTQSADVLTVCHPSYPPQNITRTDHNAWTCSAFNAQNGPFTEINTNTAYEIKCSASTGTVTLTATGHTPFTADNIGDLLYLEELPTAAIGAWEVAKATVNGDIVTAGNGYYQATSANPAASVPRITGSLRPDHLEGKAWDGTGLLNGAVYRPPAGAVNIDAYVGVEWEYLHSGFGIVQITAVASTTSATATVVKYVPASLASGNGSYKWAWSAWSVEEGYPAATGYYNQRQVFGGTADQPQTVWFSAVNGYRDFGTSLPVLDDEAITFTLASREVNEIRHFVPLSELILLTSGGEWLVKGDSSGGLTPGSINVKAQGFGGASYLPPIIIGSTALYVQEKGSQVRGLGYSFEQDAFIGNDLTVLANHMFQGRTLVSWAFQKIPFSTAWCVRDDGVLLGLTYLREQEVIGWHRHITDGLFESVACISEGNEDAVYFVINRTIGGSTKRYIERLDTRFVDDMRDYKFLDSSLSYDGRNTTAKTMTLSGGTTYGHTETFTCTASASTFVSGDVGNEVHYIDEDNGITYRLRITAYTSGTVVTVQPNRTIPAAYRSARTDWALAKDTFAGLSHLEGETVGVLADGNVHPQETVASGEITLDQPAAVVHIGLPYTATFRTLPLSVGGQNIRDKQKLINKVSLICEDSRGIWAGPDTAHLYEYKQRATENYDQAITPSTDMFEIQIPAQWDKNGIVVVQQSDPLPLTILAAIPEVVLGGS